jgi:hypothetical protein
MFLDEILQGALDEEIALIFLHGKDDLGSTAKRGIDGIALNGKMTTGLGLPDVLLVIVVLGDDGDRVSNEVRRVETRDSASKTSLNLPYTKLTNHGYIGTVLDHLHKVLGSRTGDGTEVIDQVSLSHTNSRILQSQDITRKEQYLELSTGCSSCQE